MSKILDKNQENFLHCFSSNKLLTDKFYLSGGTALCEYYIPYRYSEDLDFFTEEEVDLEPITVFFKSIKKQLGYTKFDIQTRFNRNLFFIDFPQDALKTEFTYYPFTRIEKGFKKNNLQIDSILDIAVNKLFTIYQKPRSRDFMDLYMVNQKNLYLITDLIKKARAKFDWQVDLLTLGSQFLQASRLKDYPRLKIKLNHKDWQNYFVEEAKRLKKDIVF